MENENFLQNQWVVGIGCSIISSIIIYIISSFFLTRRKRKEYKKQIIKANDEVANI